MTTNSNQDQRAFKGVWIDASIWLDKELSLQEKVMLVEIDSLCTVERGCYKRNKAFSEFFQLSESRVSEVIKSLERKGYISIQYRREGKQIIERNIYIENILGKPKTPLRKTEGPSSENRRPPSENAEESNTLRNTKESNSKEKHSLPSKLDDGVKQVIEFLNSMTGSKYKASTKSHASNISGRLNEGHSVDDLMAVVRFKVGEWLHDPKMAQYLRPETLFQAGKFNGYLTASRAAQSLFAEMSPISRQNAQNLMGKW